MKLDAFREAVLDEARADADRRLEEAERNADERTDDARRRADELLEEAREEGRRAADRETHRRRSEARREARERILRAHRDAVERARERSLEKLRQMQDHEEYEELMGRLEQLAHQQLGDDIEMERDAEIGGFVARADSRRVDYRLPVLVDRAMEEMGSELRNLWQ